MIYTEFMTPREVAVRIAASAKAKRLSENLTQKSLSERSSVSLGVLKKFELTGKISLESLLKLAVSLGVLGDFIHLFEKHPDKPYNSIEEVLKENKRKRGRR